MEEKNIEQQIIQVARQVFIEKGFAEASMTDIARCAGISRTVLNYYFRTKEKLFAAVFSDIIHDFIPRLKDIALSSGPLDDTVSAIVDIYFDIMHKEPRLPLFMVREINRDATHLFATLKELDTWKYLEILKQRIRQKMANGEIKRVPLPFIFYTFYGLMVVPFLTEPLVELFVGNKVDDKLLMPWHQHVIDSIHQLLAVDNEEYGPVRRSTKELECKQGMKVLSN